MYTKKQLQVIRGIDVIVFGPLLILASSYKALPMALRVALFATGVLTMGFNLMNFIDEMEE